MEDAQRPHTAHERRVTYTHQVTAVVDRTHAVSREGLGTDCPRKAVRSSSSARATSEAQTRRAHALPQLGARRLLELGPATRCGHAERAQPRPDQRRHGAPTAEAGAEVGGEERTYAPLPQTIRSRTLGPSIASTSIQ